MARTRTLVLSLTACGAAMLLGACAISGGVPTIVADAEPIPGGCPPSICPQHTPTQPPPPDEPSPDPTATASTPGQPEPKPKPSSPGGVIPGPRTSPTPGATNTVAPAIPVAPSKTRFAAFPFSAFPYDQAFPRDPPPAPAPLSLPPPTGLVALAAVLAAGVAAAASAAARRRAWDPTPLPGGAA
jgi:hypothetical protein